ncbi:hypothetical protein [Hymenobacter terrestris]|uniref:Uncharacterized protein n=1 Tax=Hymenobacter terrestris TaxID=2748310 RepID=A0ABX2Q7D3_9BACT|nr:hypothetical protein [Hymenobacter terrestris]NVO86336.1 hypothetical protein [Hymenobacter terrestris]
MYLLRRTPYAAGRWARQLPGFAEEIGADGRGHVYVLGAPASRPTSESDGYAPLQGLKIWRYDSLGCLQAHWPVRGRALTMAVGPRGHVLVLHDLDSTNQSDHASTSAVQLSLFDPAGRLKWSRPGPVLPINWYLGRHMWRDAVPIAGLDRRGRAWLRGWLTEPVKVARRDSAETIPWHTTTNAFFRYAANGRLTRTLLLTTRPSQQDQPGAGLAVAPGGTAYVAAQGDSSSWSGAHRARRQLRLHGSYLLRISSGGRLRLARVLPHPARAIALDKAGAPCVLGSARRPAGGAGAGTEDELARGHDDVWVGRFSRGGWFRGGLYGGGSNDENGLSFAIGGGATVYTAGTVHTRNQDLPPGSTRFGSVMLSNEHDYGQPVLVVYDSVGALQDARRLNSRESPGPAELREKYAGYAGQTDFYSLAASTIPEGMRIVRDVVTDAQGNVYALARLRGHAAGVHPGDTLRDVTPEEEDWAVVKYGTDKRLRWALQIPVDSSFVWLHQLVADARGNLFVLGTFRGSLSLNRQVVAAESKAYRTVLFRLDTLGGLQWSWVGEARQEQWGLDHIVPDGRGGVYGLGVSAETPAFGPFRLPAPPAPRPGFLPDVAHAVAFNAGGRPVWVRTLRGANPASTFEKLRLGADPRTGDLTLAVLIRKLPAASGQHARQAGGAWLFDTGNPSQPVYRHALDSLKALLWVRYNPGGGLQWIRQSELYPDLDFQFAVGPSGTMYLGGVSRQQLPGEPDSTWRQVLAKGPDWMLAGFDSGARLRWGHRGSPGQQLEALAAGPDGAVVGGRYYACDGATVPCQLWVRAYRSQGALQWEQHSAGTNPKSLLGLSLSPRSQVHLTTEFRIAAPPALAGTTHFGSVELTGLEPANDLFNGGGISYFWLQLHFAKEATNRP